MKEIQDLNKKELKALLQNAAKNWLAHDGLWFQAAEIKFDLDTAMELDAAAWEKFTVIEAKRISDTRCVFRMKDCRVQSARKRRNLPDFPCKSVGIIEYTGFARTIDPRIKTRCLTCPPDPHPPDIWCAWEFTLEK